MSDNERYDAIIIGAGVIGGATAFELAKKGWRTLNVDKLPASGYGSTSNSCAIVRAHYSTFDGVAMAYEGFSYWKDWSNYLDSEDERGHALYMQCGTVLFMLEGGHHEKVLPLFDEVGVPYRDTGQRPAPRALPVLRARNPRRTLPSRRRSLLD